jgi:mono/diheme cytochrome c family protein
MLNAPVPASGADGERGRALYENHCQACHSSKVHGRKQRWPENLAQLRAIVAQWQAQQVLNWSGEEIDDVVYFLNITQYSY